MSELEYPQDCVTPPSTSGCASGLKASPALASPLMPRMLGDVVYVSLPAVGDSLGAGDSCGEVESTKSVSDLYAPLSGEVLAVNTMLDSAPELVKYRSLRRGMDV